MRYLILAFFFLLGFGIEAQESSISYPSLSGGSPPSSVIGQREVTFVRNGNNSNVWLRLAWNGAKDSDDEPYIVPFNGVLRGITITNANDNTDGVCQVFLNGAVPLGAFWAYTDLKNGIATNYSIPVVQGDLISVFNIITGDAGDDMIVKLNFEILSQPTTIIINPN